MTDELKVPEAPEKTAEAPAAEKLIDNPRAAIENAVIAENERLEEVVEDAAPQEEAKVEDKPELSEVDRIKAAVQKRIDKVVAKEKTAIERAEAAEAELATLKANLRPAETQKTSTEELTSSQIKAWMIQQAEDGTLDKVSEVKANILLMEATEREAVKRVEDRQVQAKKDAEQRVSKENQSLLDLAKDYITYDAKGQVDMTSDLTLANQKGKLFQSAMALYNDPELHKLYYNDPDRASGLRRAVQDANKELHAQGLIKTPKVDGLETRRVPRQVLADPDAVEAEDTPPSSPTLLSDAEKVRAEITARSKLRSRRTS